MGGKVQSKLLWISPFRCRMWKHHDRLEDYITEESCTKEIESFTKCGQLVPVLGRPVHDDSRHDVELVYGARRLFVAREANVPLQVELRELTDREAIILMDMENSHRLDLSPYERGLSYMRWLRAGLFCSQEDIAKALNISRAQVSRLLKLAQLPAVLVNAFKSPLEIREAWAPDLLEVWQLPARRELMAKRARKISAGAQRPPAIEVFRQLVSERGVVAQRRSATVRDQVVRADDGEPLFRVRHLKKSIALLVPARLSQRSLDAIKNSITEILKGEPKSERPASTLEYVIASRAAARVLSSSLIDVHHAAPSGESAP